MVRRRDFIAGAALGAAGGFRLAYAGFALEPVLPSSAAALLDSGAIKLLPAGRGRWAAENVAVELAETGGHHAVRIRAPGVALRSVTLSWPQTAPERVLGDHWERTYGDVGWNRIDATVSMPWYFLARYPKHLEAFGVRTGGASFASWQWADGARRLTLDTATGGIGVQLGARALDAAEIVAARSVPGESAFRFLRRFVTGMASRPARPLAQPVYGINDWYFAYGKNSDALILEHSELLAPCAEGLENRPFSVIDAGWFIGTPQAPDDCCFGADMRTPNVRFKDMGALATNIRKFGMRPGLWTRPLCATAAGKPGLLLPAIPGRTDAQRPILDPTIPENLATVSDYFAQYRRWGYELVKIDFTTFDILGKWGFEMLRDRALTAPGWRMNDVGRTNAEIIRDLYATMRAAAGDTHLIGCNTVSQLSAGVFEINRIGDDTSGKEWDRTRKMGVNTLAFRGAHQGAFYAADADCVGLTPHVPWEKNRQWMGLVAKSGTPLFISAQPESIGAEQRAAIRDSFALASRGLPLGEPIDWMTNAWPREWQLNGRREQFDWS